MQSKAHRSVSKAIKAGQLAALDGSVLCVDCSKVAQVYDHRDYSKPLEVEPVCYKCNTKRGSAANYTPESDHLTIRVDENDLEALKRIAKERRTTVAQLMREAMARFIESESKEER